MWQTKWQRVNIGRATFNIMTRVGCQLKFPNDRCSARLLDDSMLKAHQHRIGLEESKSCDCGLGIDDIDHFLPQCTLYDELRQVLKQEVQKVWEACESRGWLTLNLSVQLLPFPFTSDQLTCQMLWHTVSIIQLHQELSETVVISCFLVTSSSST